MTFMFLVRIFPQPCGRAVVIIPLLSMSFSSHKIIISTVQALFRSEAVQLIAVQWIAGWLRERF